MMKFLLSKHSRSIFIFALLSLFMCMAAGKASAAGLNPVVKIDKTSYTSSGTEVTLKLWMFNWKYAAFSPKQYNARFTGDVYLYIDDKEVANLNEMWLLISGSSYTFFKDEPGIVGKSSGINLDGTNVGTAQLQDFKSGQTCPYNSNTTEDSWSTVDLKISFNKSFSYYGHKITVKGKWQDQGSGSVVEKNVALDNTINGFVRPVNLSAQPSGDKTVFSWEQEGYNNDASIDGKWIVYKREDGNNVKLGEVAANEHSLSIEKKKYSCSNNYIMTFLPNVCVGEETVCGLTTSLAATGHQINDDDICQMCGHSFFRYHTSDGNIVDISGKDFGANVVSHEVINGECVIEFDASITQISSAAFQNKKLVGELRIPNTVTSIQNDAFNGCSALTGDLIIPNSVTEIGNNAFNGCTGFNGTLTLSSNLETIGDNAFCNCSGFTESLTLPNSVTTIGESAFAYCGRFTSLKLSDALTVIPKWAFMVCKFKGTLMLPSRLKMIDDGAFESCSEFTGVLTLPNSVTTIGASAFGFCSGFTELKLSEALTVIHEFAFQCCNNLTIESENPSQVTLPKSLERIENGVFRECNQIKIINFQSLPEVISSNIGNFMCWTVSLSDDSYISDKASLSVTVDAISYTRQMSNDWGTLVLPYSLTLTGSEPYRLYAISAVSENELVLKQLDGEVAAGTPCVVKRNGSESELRFEANNAAIKTVINGSPVGDMTFNGTYKTKEVTKGYVIAKDCFWNVAELMKNKPEAVKGAKVSPFRAWLDGTSANAPAQLSMRIDGSTTGIDAIDAINDAEAEYYDLSGKRLDEPQKGVNIVRMKSGKTKKIIIK
ncbi:leucine-rich repeat domain-containing protein [Prevotella sp.]|nr:leucine-rich repeat domain-containing protein [Prevotella sp.]